MAACGGLPTVVSTSPTVAGRFYTRREMALLSRLSDLIIPRTETPGALDVNVPGYLDGLMSDWANDATRRAHRESLLQLERSLEQRAGGEFTLAEESVAERALTELDAAAFNGDDNLRGYRNLKGYITRAYFATEGGAVEELKWVSVPGRWDPAVEISS